MPDKAITQASARRQAAIDVMHRFAVKNGMADPAVREETREGVVCFIGTAPDGREYAVGYEAGPSAV